MLLEVKLVNVKSYDHAVVRFSEGLNAIIGENGAGKTTILEAVGFALFDTLPYKMSEFIRRGEKKGEISVKLMAPDGRVYTVVRKFGESGTTDYYVLDSELGRIAEGKSEVRDWVKEVFGIEIDPPSLFENAIGVAQGKMTSQFLESPSVREAIFSPIIGVDGYKRAFEKAREYEKFLEDRLNEVNARIIELRAHVSRKESLLTKKKELEEKLNRLAEKEEGLFRSISPVRKRVEEFEALSKEISQLRPEAERLRERSANLARTTKKLQEELEELNSLEKKMRDARESYMRYLAAEKKEAELENKLKEVSEEIEKLEKLAEEAIRLREQLKILNERLKEVERAEKELEEISPLAEEEEMLAEVISKIERAEKLKKEISEQIRFISRSLEEKKRQLEVLSEKEEKARQIEEAVRKLQKVDEARESLIRKLSKYRTELKLREKQLEKMENERCPILDIQCEKISDARTELLKEIESIKIKIGELEKKSEKIQGLAEKKRDAELKLNRLRGELKQKGALLREIEEHKSRLEKMENQLKELEKEVQRKKDVEERLERVKGSVSRREQLKAIVSGKDAIINDLRQSEKRLENISAEIEKLKELRMKEEGLRKELHDARMEKTSCREGYEFYTFASKRIEEKPGIEEELQEVKKELLETNSRLKVVEGRLRELERKFSEEEYRQSRAELERLTGELEAVRTEKQAVSKNLGEVEEELRDVGEKEELLKGAEHKKSELERRYRFIKDVREVFRAAIPEITRAYVEAVSVEANRIFCELMGDYGWDLRWGEDFGIRARYMGREIDFAQMSGGEQMCAALAVRLALLKITSSLGLAFFDEPTQNMDEYRRRNFASQIGRIKGFRQIFVISHDDTFEEMVENAVKIVKERGTSRVVG